MTRRTFAAAFTGMVLIACGGGSAAAPPKSTAAPAARPVATPTVAPTPDVIALAALLEGRYTGSWNNTTFATAGPITVDVKLDRESGTVAITLTLGGDVFGSAAPPPETITIKPDGSRLSYQGRSAVFGDLVATLTLAGLQGSVTMRAGNVPNSRVSGFDAVATIADPRSFGGRYTVTLRDGSPPEQGTFTLAKIA